MKRWYKTVESCINMRVLKYRMNVKNLMCNSVLGCRPVLCKEQILFKVNEEGIFNVLTSFVAYVKGRRRASYIHEGYETVNHKNNKFASNFLAILWYLP